MKSSRVEFNPALIKYPPFLHDPFRVKQDAAPQLSAREPVLNHQVNQTKHAVVRFKHSSPLRSERTDDHKVKSSVVLETVQESFSAKKLVPNPSARNPSQPRPTQHTHRSLKLALNKFHGKVSQINVIFESS